MRTAPFLLVASLLAACIKPIPVPCVDAADCDAAAGGACVASSGVAWCAYADPACPGSQRYASDVGDDLAGTCVPLVASCEPREFQACTGDQLTRCNATGTGTETVVCELGCSEALAGCRLCEASTTACTNGTVATCDADGRPTATRDCPLGCFADEPRCREIVPSNGLGQFLAEAEAAPDIVLADRDWVDAEGYVWRNDTRTSLHLTTYLLPAPEDGVPIRVLVVGSISIGTTELAMPVFDFRDDVLPAVAIVAARDIVVRGVINLTGMSLPTPDSKYGTSYHAPGSIARGHPCVGGSPDETTFVAPGAGGGGNAGLGASGGSAGGGNRVGSGGRGTGVGPTLEPLRGGCAGGYVGDLGGSGGGALQLVSASRIVLTARSGINAGGAGGSTPLGSGAGGGGGAGGGILLEAPIVELGRGAGLTANGGGGGGAGGNPGTSGRLSMTPASGGVGCVGDDTTCTAGGSGAVNNIMARPGVDAVPRPGTAVTQAGGGGGGIGVIRINTPDGSYAAEADVILSPTPTTGALGIR
jgi:hypothetical protein